MRGFFVRVNTSMILFINHKNRYGNKKPEPYNESRNVKKEIIMAEARNLKLGLFSYSYHLAFGKHPVFEPEKKMDLFEFMDRCKAFGLDGIQIDPQHLECCEDEYLQKIVDYANGCGFYIEYGTTGVETEHLLRQLEIAKKLTSPILRTYIGFDPHEKGIDPVKEVSYAIDVLNHVKGKAEEYNIKIAVENHCDLKTDELVELIRKVDSPYVGVCVDLGNFMIHLENPVESVKKLAPYIYSTHFKDYNSKMMNWGFKTFGVPLGEGKIDLAAVVDILVNDSGLDRIMLEIPVEKCDTEKETLEHEEDTVRKSVRYAREELGIR